MVGTLYAGGATHPPITTYPKSAKTEASAQKATHPDQEHQDCGAAAHTHPSIKAWRGSPDEKDGVPPPLTLVTPTTKRAYEAIFTRNLSESQIAALDELFLAAVCKAGRAPRRTTTVAA